jgi:hypothetical protein
MVIRANPTTWLWTSKGRFNSLLKKRKSSSREDKNQNTQAVEK